MGNTILRPRGWLIPALGLTQIVAWGSMFYAYGVLARLALAAAALELEQTADLPLEAPRSAASTG